MTTEKGRDIGPYDEKLDGYIDNAIRASISTVR
jgi:hypothetical protein